MGVDPARQTSLPTGFSEWATFATLGTVPHISVLSGVLAKVQSPSLVLEILSDAGRLEPRIHILK